MPGYFSSHPIAKILVALIIFWFGFEIGELKGAIQERYLGPDRQGDGQMHSGGWRSAGMLPVKIMNSAGAAGSQINTQN